MQWYDRRGAFSRRWYLRLKIVSIVCAALVPVAALLPASGIVPQPVVTAMLGMMVVIVEGVQQVNGFHDNWYRYRATAENLKHEKYLFLAGAGAYADAANPKRLMAERVEELVSTEQARWVSSGAQTTQRERDGGAPSPNG